MARRSGQGPERRQILRTRRKPTPLVPATAAPPLSRLPGPVRYNYKGTSEGAVAVQPISGFVDHCCLLARNARTPAVEVYLAYVVWCLDGGIPVQDQFTFLDMLECYGLKLRQRKQQMWIRGIAVLPAYRVTAP